MKVNMLKKPNNYIFISGFIAAITGVLASSTTFRVPLFLLIALSVLFLIFVYKKIDIRFLTLKVFFVILAIENDVGFLGLNMVHWYLVFMLASLIIYSFKERTNEIKKTTLYLFFCLLTYIVISSIGMLFFSELKFSNGLMKAFKNIVLPTFSIIYLFKYINSKKIFYSVIQVVILTSTLFSIVAIIQFLSKGLLLSGLLTNYRYLGLFNTVNLYISTADIQYIRAFVPHTDTFRAHGSFYAHNSFAAFVGSIAPLTIICIVKEKSKKIIYLFSLLVQTIAVYLTFSRGGLITLLLAYIIIYVIFYRKNKVIQIVTNILLILILIPVTVISYLLIGGNFHSSRFLNFDFKNISEFSDRITLWNITIKESINYLWFGTGNDFLNKNLTSFLIFEDVSPHNMFLHIIYSQGLLSLIILILLLLRLIVIFIKALTLNMKSENEIVLICIFSSIVSYVGSGMLESMFINLNLKLLFCVLMSLFFIYYKIQFNKKEGKKNV
ncbi:O-antigen ligase family protein [Priestia flexa]|uniref:O-antigen ligase family protein n=1 Tax=Priestia flexa TaxID=86664 RepID=UPI001CD28B41|nr:O-antigen ligase family protein [Priestia flexa]MCA1202279.1 O-antigen ligase family protein [Priestia flexa]